MWPQNIRKRRPVGEGRERDEVILPQFTTTEIFFLLIQGSPVRPFSKNQGQHTQQQKHQFLEFKKKPQTTNTYKISKHQPQDVAFSFQAS